MRYTEESGEIEIGCRELIALARRRLPHSSPEWREDALLPDREKTRRLYLPDATTTPIRFSFCVGAYPFVLRTQADDMRENQLTFLCICEEEPTRPDKETLAQARGEAYLCAYAYCMCRNVQKVTLRYLWVNTVSGTHAHTSETVSREKLHIFFTRCTENLPAYGAPQIDRAKNRLPSLRSLVFPFPRIRQGQDTFMREVYRTIARGGTLFAQAPTGVGKTVSVLYPALRAMGAGKCEKIFYLTPKGTTAKAARDCLEKLCANGAQLRAMILSSKERICTRGLVCRVQKGTCQCAQNRSEADAALALFHRNIPVVCKEEFTKCAEEYHVCPHELSLCYAQLCDVVICDLNYLFDPFICLHRFFDEGGDYAFLVDEAHNLYERASEMYSAQIGEDELGQAPWLASYLPLQQTLKKACEQMRQMFLPLVRDQMCRDEQGKLRAFCHTHTLPEGIYDWAQKLESAVRKARFAQAQVQDPAGAFSLREMWFRLRAFLFALSHFEQGYECFVRWDSDHLTVKLFCVDPGKILAEQTEKGRGTVYFSGTLTPVSYYRDVLGGTKEARMLEVDSPFVREQLCVSVMDKISTRYTERERTLPAVLRVIAATVGAKRGHYMVFSPSFSYNEMLAEAFRRQYPNIRTLVQTRTARQKERDAFLLAFSDKSDAYLIAFCVMGGIFAEGIDLTGEKLIGAIVIGTGLPGLSCEREAMAAYFEQRYEAGKAYAYMYPGLNRVLQAAGRVIRTEDDRGVIVLIDDRLADPLYRKQIPALWHGLKFVGDAKGLRLLIDRFWAEQAKTPPHSLPPRHDRKTVCAITVTAEETE